MKRPHLPRFGLRARSSLAFALVGLTLSLVLSFVTYNRSRTYLLSQREAFAIRQASFDAQQVANALRNESADPKATVDRLTSGLASEPLLRKDGRWYVTRVNSSPQNDLPDSFLRNALNGKATRQRFARNDQPFLAVAIPLGPSNRSPGLRDTEDVIPTMYFEVSNLNELERTLSALGRALAAGAIVATVLGALLGLLASRRIMRPLGTIAVTAEKIEKGDLSARLANSKDRDLARLVSSFNSMTDSLEEKIQRERRFASHVSHELRSPLTSMRGAVELVANRKGELGERAQLGVELLEKDVKRFERIVLDLLEIARIEAGAASIDMVSLRAEPLLRSVLTHLAIDPALLEVAKNVGTREVQVDARRFERVVANLVENANNHGGGVKAIRLQRVEKILSVHVDDAGPGVPFSERDRVFERFARGGNGRHLPGAGLGLALVTEHLRLMGGTISITESPEHGARFTVSLQEHHQ
jgi:two-component system, OmpR family, sensor histidine kinase MtrB